MARRILITALCFALYISASSQGFDAALTQLSDDISSKIRTTGKRKVAVWDFTDTEGKITNLGKYLSEEVSVNLTNASYSLNVMDRNHLNTILREHKLNAEGVVDVNTAKQLGKINAVDAIITGTVTVFVDKIRLTIKVLDTETALIIAATKGDLPISKEIASFLGVPGMGSEGVSSTVNRGFNSPLNPNEQYNNPGTVAKDCESKRIGDYCFSNLTKDDFIIQISGNTLVNLAPGQTKCLYGLVAGTYSFHVLSTKNYNRGAWNIYRMPSSYKYTFDKGQFLVEACKSKTYVLK